MKTDILENYTITKKGMRFLKNILFSSPACVIKKPELLKNDSEMTLAQIFDGLSPDAAMTIYGYLFSNGIQGQSKTIDFKTIVLAFADRLHSNSARDNIQHRSTSVGKWQEMGFELKNQNQKLAYIFGHTLIKAKVISREPDGFWSAKAGRIILSGLYLPEDIKVQINQTVFLHFATIVGAQDNGTDIKLIPGRSADYRTCFKKSLSDWTKENFEKYKI